MKIWTTDHRPIINFVGSYGWQTYKVPDLTRRARDARMKLGQAYRQRNAQGFKSFYLQL